MQNSFVQSNGIFEYIPFYKTFLLIYFLMQIPSQYQQQITSLSPKIHFSQKVFGKPTKNRTEDPSMFQLLAWTNQSTVAAADFKKKQHFTDPETAYLKLISKQPWITESQQNYLNFNSNSIEVNEQVFRQVENYIHNHEPKKNEPRPVKKDEKMMKKNKNEFNEKQRTGKKPLGGQYQNPKVSGTVQKANNYVDQHSPKYSTDQKQDMRKRPSSAKNINSMNSPKASTSKQVYSAVDDQGYEQKIIRKRDELTQEEQQKLIQKFKQTTRWIPNTSFTTYFGKPPFENYGRGNTKPIDGGLVYGTYLYSHNVCPHRGANSPSHVQSYPVALMKAKSMGRLIPSQPKTICKYLENKINNQKQRQYDEGAGSIQALKNNFQSLQIEVPDLRGVQKFGGTKMTASRTKYSHDQQGEYTGYEGKKYSNRKL